MLADLSPQFDFKPLVLFIMNCNRVCENCHRQPFLLCAIFAATRRRLDAAFYWKGGIGDVTEQDLNS
jgi:hypothetical protein